MTALGLYSERTHIRSRFPGTVLCGRPSEGLTVVAEVRSGEEAGLCRACWRAAKRNR